MVGVDYVNDVRTEEPGARQLSPSTEYLPFLYEQAASEDRRAKYNSSKNTDNS